MEMLFPPLQVTVPLLLIVPPLRKRVPVPLMFSDAPEAMLTVVSISQSPLQFMAPLTVSPPAPDRVPLVKVRIPFDAIVPAAEKATALFDATLSVCVPLDPPPTVNALNAGLTSRLTV